MSQNTYLIYYQRNKELLSGKNKKYYQKNKDRLSTQARDKYRNLSEEKKKDLNTTKIDVKTGLKNIKLKERT